MKIVDPTNYTVTVTDPGGTGRTATFVGKDGRHFIMNDNGELTDLTDSIPHIPSYERGIANMIAYQNALDAKELEKKELESTPPENFEYFDGDNEIHLFGPNGKVYRGQHGNDTESSKKKFVQVGDTLYVTDPTDASYAIIGGETTTFYSVEETLPFETEYVLILDETHPYYDDETARTVYAFSKDGEREVIDWYSVESVPHLVPGEYPLENGKYTFMTDISPYEKTIASGDGRTYVLEKDGPVLLDAEATVEILASVVEYDQREV